MKLLFTHRYYWPDTAPYAVMLRTIADHFADAGHDVNVFSSKVSYRDVSNTGADIDDGKISVKRCWVLSEKKRNPILRMLNVLIYCWSLFFHVLRTKPDIVTASTFPPVLAAWSASLAARLVGAKFVYHMMDIHPEVSQISGGLLGRKPVLNILRWMDNATLRRSWRIVVLSQDMADTLAARGIANLPVQVINNFMLDTGADTPPPSEWVKDPKVKRIIFAGNMGRFQNLDIAADGIAQVLDEHPDLELLFLGDGKMKPVLQAKWQDQPRIKFAPFLPFEQAKALIADADLGIVSLEPNIYKVAYPSKVLTYLGLGVPILALVEPESGLATDLVDNGLGVCARENTAQSVAQAVRVFLKSGKSKAHVSDWSQENTALGIVLAQWDRLILDRATD